MVKKDKNQKGKKEREFQKETKPNKKRQKDIK